MLKVPPVTTTLVGASVLPALLVQVPSSVDLDVAADGGISAGNVNGGGSRHTTPSVCRGVSRKSDTWSGAIQQQTRAADKNATAAVSCRIVSETGRGDSCRKGLNKDPAAIRRFPTPGYLKKLKCR